MIKLLEFDDYIVLNLYHILSSNLVSIHASIPASSDKDELGNYYYCYFYTYIFFLGSTNFVYIPRSRYRWIVPIAT